MFVLQLPNMLQDIVLKPLKVEGRSRIRINGIKTISIFGNFLEKITFCFVKVGEFLTKNARYAIFFVEMNY